jgi:nucleoside-diphosphate-sugar epimerase
MTQHRDRTGSGRLAAYRQVNVGGTVSLAKHAIAAGVKRLIYLSSIKVHGEGTLGAGGIPSSEGDDRFIFKNSDSVSPTDPYAISKWEAENALWELSTQSGLEVVVIRSPLIYGPGVKGNLARLMRLIEKNIPLPFGAINNSRSLIGLDNLIDLIRCCVRHPSAPSNTLLVRDGHDISTPELLHHIATAQGVPLRLFSVPVSVLRAVGLILGRSEEIDRLIGCMRIDDKFTRDLLSWSPPQTVEYGVARMVQLK